MIGADRITEARRAASFALDNLSAAELAEVMNREDATVADAVAASLAQIAGVVDELVAGAGAPTFAEREAAEDDAEAGRRAIDAAAVTRADAVVVVSASGSTPYALGAARAAARTGAFTA